METKKHVIDHGKADPILGSETVALRSFTSALMIVTRLDLDGSHDCVSEMRITWILESQYMRVELTKHSIRIHIEEAHVGQVAFVFTDWLCLNDVLEVGLNELGLLNHVIRHDASLTLE